MIGQVLGHYKILKLLGKGGMGSVYLAEQLGLRRRVALKVLHPELSSDSVIVERFLREARIAANLGHDHIVTIFDVGQIEHSHYIAMRYIEGESLAQLLRREGALDPHRTLAMLEQIADALDFAHEHAILHRDIKPANIMVEEGDFLTLTDFGIARAAGLSNLTSARTVIGTPQYMSPEQARGETVDKRSDLYALGVMLHEMLSGRPPFQADTTPSLLFLHVHEPPPALHTVRPGLPPALSTVVARALAKDPNARYQTGRAMVDAVRAALEGQPGAAEESATMMYQPAGGSSTPSPVPQVQTYTPTPTPAPAPPPSTPSPATSTPYPARPTPYPGQSTPYPAPATPYPSPQTPYPAWAMPAPAGGGTGTGPWQPAGSVVAQPGSRSPAPAATPTPVPVQPYPLSYPGVQPQPYEYGPAQSMPTGFPVDSRRGTSTNPVLMALMLAMVMLLVLFGGILVLDQAGILDRLLSPATPTVVTTAAEPTAAMAVVNPAPATPAAATLPPTAIPTAAPRPTATAVPTPVPPTPAPPDRVAEAQRAVAAGDLPAAIQQLEATRQEPAIKANPMVLASVEETLRKAYVTHGNQLLNEGKLDESAVQFVRALTITPMDPEALDGQKRVTLTRHYQTMEVNWGKNDDAAMRALEEIMLIDAGYRETREKLYALLIAKADRLIAGGDRNGAFSVLIHAQNVVPGRPEARQRLASYTPTPAPAVPPPAAPPPTRAPNPPPPAEPTGPFQPPGRPV